VLHREELADLFHIVGHNEFRTSFAVEEAVSTRANIVVLSILRPCDPPSLATLEGVHLGVTPDNNADWPAVPYAAKVVLAETSRELADAARAGLIQNHPLATITRAPGWTAAERRQLDRLDLPSRLAGGCDAKYGLMLAGPAASQRATARRRGPKN
jgi:hypothetical protein